MTTDAGHHRWSPMVHDRVAMTVTMVQLGVMAQNLALRDISHFEQVFQKSSPNNVPGCWCTGALI